MLLLLRCQGLGGAKAERQEGGRLWMAGLPPACSRYRRRRGQVRGCRCSTGLLLLLVAMIRMVSEEKRGEEFSLPVGCGRGGSGKDEGGQGRREGLFFLLLQFSGHGQGNMENDEVGIVLFSFQQPATRDVTSRGVFVVSRVNNMAIVDMTTKACQIVSYRTASSWGISSRQGRCKRGLGLERLPHGSRWGTWPRSLHFADEEGWTHLLFFFSRSGAWGGRLALAKSPIFLFSISHFPLCRVADA